MGFGQVNEFAVRDGADYAAIIKCRDPLEICVCAVQFLFNHHICCLLTCLSFLFLRFKNQSKWVSARRRSESPESTEPDMVPHSVRSPERWKSPSTQHTIVSFAERTPLDVLAPEFGIADHAERWSLEVPTLSPQPVPFKHAVTSIV